MKNFVVAMTVSTVPAYVMPFATTFLTGSPSAPLMRARPSFLGRVSGVGRCRLRLPSPMSCRARADAASTNQDSSDDVALLVSEEMQLEKKVTQLRSTKGLFEAERSELWRIDHNRTAVEVEIQEKTITADKRARLMNREKALDQLFCEVGGLPLGFHFRPRPCCGSAAGDVPAQRLHSSWSG